MGMNYSVANYALSPFPIKTGDEWVWKPVIFLGLPAWPTTSTACPTLTFRGIGYSF